VQGATIVLDRTPFEKVTSILLETGIRYLLVVKDGTLKGIIKKKDVLEVRLSISLDSDQSTNMCLWFSGFRVFGFSGLMV
jgi:signal-transduction protein with cAMP-binding, CBS, and nucleotidyltransferase domain